jgi:hypothetical protein
MIRIYSYLVAAGIAMAATGGFYLWSAHNGAAKCELRVERAVAAERDRQRQAGDAALQEERQRAAERDQENEILRGKVEAYESDIANAPAAAHCIGTPADLERLQHDFLR